MNDVEALPQMMLPSANDVGCRPMKLRFAQTKRPPLPLCVATIGAYKNIIAFI